MKVRCYVQNISTTLKWLFADKGKVYFIFLQTIKFRSRNEACLRWPRRVYRYKNNSCTFASLMCLSNISVYYTLLKNISLNFTMLMASSGLSQSVRLHGVSAFGWHKVKHKARLLLHTLLQSHCQFWTTRTYGHQTNFCNGPERLKPARPIYWLLLLPMPLCIWYPGISPSHVCWTQK